MIGNHFHRRDRGRNLAAVRDLIRDVVTYDDPQTVAFAFDCRRELRGTRLEGDESPLIGMNYSYDTGDAGIAEHYCGWSVEDVVVLVIYNVEPNDQCVANAGLHHPRPELDPFHGGVGMI